MLVLLLNALLEHGQIKSVKHQLRHACLAPLDTSALLVHQLTFPTFAKLATTAQKVAQWLQQLSAQLEPFPLPQA